MLLLLFSGDEAQQQSLHGRRVRTRGRRVYFPDELDLITEPEVIDARLAKIDALDLPSLEPIARKIEEAKRAARELLERIERERKERAKQAELQALADQFEAILDRLEAAKASELAVIMRLRDDDDFFLLAL
jgi:hypothetical protein